MNVLRWKCSNLRGENMSEQQDYSFKNLKVDGEQYFETTSSKKKPKKDQLLLPLQKKWNFLN